MYNCHMVIFIIDLAGFFLKYSPNKNFEDSSHSDLMCAIDFDVISLLGAHIVSVQISTDGLHRLKVLRTLPSRALVSHW